MFWRPQFQSRNWNRARRVVEPVRTLQKLRSMAALSIFIFLFALLMDNAYGQSTADFPQAQAMLELLRSCHDNKVPKGASEHVASLLGTRLVVQQQNISRRVTTQQYTDVLKAACEPKIADVKPAEPGHEHRKA
jgi:hypothetical protein